MDEGLDYTYEAPEDVYQSTNGHSQETLDQKQPEVVTPTEDEFQTYLRHLELQQLPIGAYEYWVNTWIDQRRKALEQEPAGE